MITKRTIYYLTGTLLLLAAGLLSLVVYFNEHSREYFFWFIPLIACLAVFYLFLAIKRNRPYMCAAAALHILFAIVIVFHSFFTLLGISHDFLTMIVLIESWFLLLGGIYCLLFKASLIHQALMATWGIYIVVIFFFVGPIIPIPSLVNMEDGFFKFGLLVLTAGFIPIFSALANLLAQLSDPADKIKII